MYINFSREKYVYSVFCVLLQEGLSAVIQHRSKTMNPTAAAAAVLAAAAAANCTSAHAAKVHVVSFT